MTDPFVPNRLGGQERPHDAKDYHLGSAVAATHPPVFMQDAAFAAPIYFQGKRPACGAHAGIWLKTYLDILNGTSTAKYTPRFTWIDIKKDGTSPSDGTDMRSIFNSLRNSGANSFEPLENDTTPNDSEYARASVATPAMQEDAKTHTISAYAFGGVSFEGIKQLIYDHRAVLLLIQVGESFWTAPDGSTSWLEKDILPLRHPSPVVDGHFVVAHSYDQNYIYFANSFGSTWGRAGHGYFTTDYIPYVLETGTAVDKTNPAVLIPEVVQVEQEVETLPPAQQTFYLQWLVDFLTKLLPFIPKGAVATVGYNDERMNDTAPVLVPGVASSTDPTKVANTIKGVLLAFSGLILAIILAVFHIQVNPADLAQWITDVSMLGGALWAIWGLLHKGVATVGRARA